MPLPIKPTPRLKGIEAELFEKRARENEKKDHYNPNFEKEITAFINILKNSNNKL